MTLTHINDTRCFGALDAFHACLRDRAAFCHAVQCSQYQHLQHVSGRSLPWMLLLGKSLRSSTCCDRTNANHKHLRGRDEPVHVPRLQRAKLVRIQWQHLSTELRARDVRYPHRCVLEPALQEDVWHVPLSPLRPGPLELYDRYAVVRVSVSELLSVHRKISIARCDHPGGTCGLCACAGLMPRLLPVMTALQIQNEIQNDVVLAASYRYIQLYRPQSVPVA